MGSGGSVVDVAEGTLMTAMEKRAAAGGGGGGGGVMSEEERLHHHPKNGRQSDVFS
jgi:hypothetical protein